MNFDIALQSYYKLLGLQTPKLDYHLLFRNLTKKIDNVDFLKSFIFVPKPDSFLMLDSHLSSYYNWVTGLNNAPYTDVIEGNYIARQVAETVPMDISKKNTYYKIEKGTDINLAVHALHKAFFDTCLRTTGTTPNSTP